jgi:hypothetical protein
MRLKFAPRLSMGGGVAAPGTRLRFPSFFFNSHIDHGGFDGSGAADAPARGGDFFD